MSLADEMKKLSEAYHYDSEIYQDILKEIKEAATNGEFTIYYYFYKKGTKEEVRKVIEHLTINGFKTNFEPAMGSLHIWWS